MPTTSELTPTKRPNPDSKQKLSRVTLGGNVETEFPTPTAANPLTAENGDATDDLHTCATANNNEKREMGPDNSLACAIGIATANENDDYRLPTYAIAVNSTNPRNHSSEKMKQTTHAY